MRFCFIFFLLSFSKWSHADQLELLFSSKLQHAHEFSEIQRLREEFVELKALRLACKKQMRAHFAPISCYSSLDLEIAWGRKELLSEKRKILKGLDHMCEAATRQLRAPGKIGDWSHLSKTCSSYLREALELMAYRRQDSVTWSEN
jgi:hypothetical protein